MMEMSNCKTCAKPTPLEELASDEMCTACCQKAYGLTGLDADWDAEAERLFARLNLGDGESGGKHNDVDAVWQHPTSGAKVFVGNRRAASTRKILAKHGITSIVNCQGTDSTNFFEGSKDIRYFRMDVQQWDAQVRENDNEMGEGAAAYFAPCWEWMDASLERGENVLVHCYAGAHRAGTVGVAYLMHAAQLRLPEALRLAQHQRPIINPFARLLKLLHLLDSNLDSLQQQREKSEGPAQSGEGSGRLGGEMRAEEGRSRSHSLAVSQEGSAARSREAGSERSQESGSAPVQPQPWEEEQPQPQPWEEEQEEQEQTSSQPPGPLPPLPLAAALRHAEQPADPAASAADDSAQQWFALGAAAPASTPASAGASAASAEARAAKPAQSTSGRERSASSPAVPRFMQPTKGAMLKAAPPSSNSRGEGGDVGRAHGRRGRMGGVASPAKAAAPRWNISSPAKTRHGSAFAAASLAPRGSRTSSPAALRAHAAAAGVGSGGQGNGSPQSSVGSVRRSNFHPASPTSSLGQPARGFAAGNASAGAHAAPGARAPARALTPTRLPPRAAHAVRSVRASSGGGGRSASGGRAGRKADSSGGGFHAHEVVRAARAHVEEEEDERALALFGQQRAKAGAVFMATTTGSAQQWQPLSVRRSTPGAVFAVDYAVPLAPSSGRSSRRNSLPFSRGVPHLLDAGLVSTGSEQSSASSGQADGTAGKQPARAGARAAAGGGRDRTVPHSAHARHHKARATAKPSSIGATWWCPQWVQVVDMRCFGGSK